MEKSELIQLYNFNKTVKVGEIIQCICGGRLRKNTKTQCFCSSKCREAYWDSIDPERAARKAEAKAGRFKREK